MIKALFACWTAAALVMSAPAFAYVGPGAGITMLAALWGVLVAILAAIAAVLYWPIKSVLRKRRKKKLAAQSDTSDAVSREAQQAEPERVEDQSREYERGA